MILRLLSIGIDLLLAAIAAFIIVVLVTGGFVIELHGIHIGARSIGNALALACTLGGMRFFLRGHSPFLGVPGLPVNEIDHRALRLCGSVSGWLAALSPARAALIAVLLVAASFVLKLGNAYFYDGFYSGDDVEVHEMTFGRLFSADWPVWHLRNGFYPMTFLYPVQRVLLAWGVSSTEALVFGGRCVVVCFASATLWLLFRVATRRYGAPVGLLAMLLLGFSRLHVRFGGSELPRPVAAFFLVAAFGVLTAYPRRWGALWGGGLLGIAAAIRFSEAVFVLPAVAVLVLERRFRDGSIAALSALVTAAAIVGTSDLLYWGEAFHSLKNAVDYTLVQGLSSRGHQPFYYYAASLTSWTNLFTASLALYAFRLKFWRVALWAWLPVVVLSCLPHKEARYLVPVMPFLALSAAIAAWSLLTDLRAAVAGAAAGQRESVLAMVLVAAFIGALTYESSGFRFRRSEDGVRLARFLASSGHVDSLAAENLWKLGGHLYFRDASTLIPIAIERISEADYLLDLASTVNWVVLTRQDTDRYRHDTLLEAAGFQEATPVEVTSSYRVFRRVRTTRLDRREPTDTTRPGTDLTPG